LGTLAKSLMEDTVVNGNRTLSSHSETCRGGKIERGTGFYRPQFFRF
jgi:hypothetical protein